jgi:hypothetical protein
MASGQQQQVNALYKNMQTLSYCLIKYDIIMKKSEKNTRQQVFKNMARKTQKQTNVKQ